MSTINPEHSLHFYMLWSNYAQQERANIADEAPRQSGENLKDKIDTESGSYNFQDIVN